MKNCHSPSKYLNLKIMPFLRNDSHAHVLLNFQRKKLAQYKALSCLHLKRKWSILIRIIFQISKKDFLVKIMIQL